MVKQEEPSEIVPKSKNERDILRNYSTGDQTLNQHVYGNIPLKSVDFTKKENYLKLEIKKPDGKKQVYEQLLEKLTIMFDVAYTK